MRQRTINAWRMKVGGIHFIRIGRFQMSFCVCKSYKPKKETTTYEPRARSVMMDGRRVILPSF